jgi:glycosyltransferase 2 family protein
VLPFFLYALKETADILLSANIFWLIPAGIFFILSKWISAWRLNSFFRTIGIVIPEKENIKLYLLGMYYNLFLPGGIGGDGYKIYLLNKRSNTGMKKIFQAVLLDRITGVYALFVLVVGISYLLPYPIEYKYVTWLLIPLSFAFFYLILHKFFRVFLAVFLRTNMQSLLVQLAQLISAWCILQSIHTHDYLWEYLCVFLISSIVATIPFTIGGIGAREITFLLGADYLGLNADSSIALSLLFFLITALVSFAGIYYSFREKEIRIA